MKLSTEMMNLAKGIADKLNHMNEDELREYFNENELDSEFTVSLRPGLRLEMTGVTVWVTLGGPTVWVSTLDEAAVRATHGEDKGIGWLEPGTRDLIFRIYEELFVESI